MTLHPDLIDGEGRATTELSRALHGRGVVKTGAEGVYVAILPEKKLGIALKIEDGATRAAEAAMAALLVHTGLLARQDPAVQARINAPIRNWCGTETGNVIAGEALLLSGNA